jgi:CRP-like cAMP-binding protein
MSAVPALPVVNRLIAALPQRDARRLLAVAEPVELEFGAVLYEAGARIRYAYFPTASFISEMIRLDPHSIVEVGLIGNEGMLGASLALDATESSLTALVQGAGPAWRLTSAALLRELERSAALRAGVQRYVAVRIGQLAQTAGCTRFHLVEQRLARWLLMTQDRAHKDAFRVTHEFLAYMLGVRRVGVTKAAHALQARHLIDYRRGAVTILDRAGMEAAACACYRADLATYARLLAA